MVIIKEFNLKKLIGLVLNLICNILTNYIGVTGSGLVYSIFIFCFEFHTKRAIPIYKTCNLLAGSLNIIYILKKWRSDN